jgi:hypothetical protein
MFGRYLRHDRLGPIAARHRQSIRPGINLSPNQLPEIGPLGQLHGPIATSLSLNRKIELLSLPTPRLRIEEENGPLGRVHIGKRNPNGESPPSQPNGRNKHDHDGNPLSHIDPRLDQNHQGKSQNNPTPSKPNKPNPTPTNNPKPTKPNSKPKTNQNHNPPRKPINRQLQGQY